MSHNRFWHTQDVTHLVYRINSDLAVSLAARSEPVRPLPSPTQGGAMLGLLMLLSLVVAAVRGAAVCNKDLLVECKQLIKDNSDLFGSNKTELNQWCEEKSSALECIDGYKERCLTPAQKSFLNQMVGGIISVYHDLCEDDSALQLQHLQHSKCTRGHYETCLGVYRDITEEIKAEPTNKMHKICCGMKDYLRCSEETVRDKCGEEAAQFTKTILRRLSSGLMDNFCVAIFNTGDVC